MGKQASGFVAQKIGSEVKIGSIRLGFFNRIIIDDISISDQQGRQMINAGRVAAKIEILPITKGKVVVSSAQLFGLNADLYQRDAQTNPNFQFLLDSLSSKKEAKVALDLQINSLIIRNGQITWNRIDKPKAGATFNPNHIDARGITAHLILNQLTNDSLNLNVKRLALRERSGLHLKKLALKIVANRESALLKDLHIELPGTKLESELFTFKFQRDKNTRTTDLQKLQFAGNINAPVVTPADFLWLSSDADKVKEGFQFSSFLSGTSSSLLVENLKFNSFNKSITLNIDGSIRKQVDTPSWFAKIHQLHIDKNSDSAKKLLAITGKNHQANEMLNRLNGIDFTGEARGRANHLGINGTASTGIGKVKLAAEKHFSALEVKATTESFHLGNLLDDNTLGTVAADIALKTTLGQSSNNASIKATVPHLDYQGYTYQNILVDGKTTLSAQYRPTSFDGRASINDPNGKIVVEGKATMGSGKGDGLLIAKIQASNLNPSATGLTTKWKGDSFDFTADANLRGSNIQNATGTLHVSDFKQTSANGNYLLHQLLVTQTPTKHLTITSDFGELHADGQYSYTSIANSLTNILQSKIPTLSLSPRTSPNRVTIEANIYKSDWLYHFFDIPVELDQPVHLSGNIDDNNGQLNLTVEAPAFSYDGAPYQDAHANFTTVGDTLRTDINLKKMMGNGNLFTWTLNADAADNTLAADVSFDNHASRPFRGTIHTNTKFYRDNNLSTADIQIKPSTITIGDTIWNVEPSQILYDGRKLQANHVAIRHDRQFLDINGTATASHEDTLTVDLQDINVSYILDFVNFHSVSFRGLATGKGHVTGVFAKPEAEASLTVSDFHFQDGPMGTLRAYAKYNRDTRRIELSATADEGLYAKTLINGYISPAQNYLDLDIVAQNSNLAFTRRFCKNFMQDINAHGNGRVRVFGALKKSADVPGTNLSGMVVADGTVAMRPLHTTYTLRNDTIRLIPDEIIFSRDSIFDRHGHHAIIDGRLHHTSLRDITYDINISADNLLAYDRQGFGEDTYCGTVYGTGTCNITGKKGETNIDIEVVPNAGTVFRYNASTPSTPHESSFLTWGAPSLPPPEGEVRTSPLPASPQGGGQEASDIHMNFLIHANPDATLDVLMDEDSGDNIALHGNGTLRATWFNKGAFDMFGNYAVTDGTYKLSIQNVIKKEFQFQPGSSIAFGGDPYDAVLSLKAQYTVNGVPLSDLNIGRSFTSNNIRVNCLMNIGGTPQQPHVDFGLDMPTISADARQMVLSLINSEEELNQQVIYLLTVGRFLSQGANNANENNTRQSQTSLAMQSLLSGTISQQLNNLLKGTLNTSNWNFGAHISTGDEGFNNAQYEGILSGRMLNNRLLINGEFGYRDNANQTTSFIGDFDIRYLLLPNGNLSLKVYNQTNDRYFTRNSLNTQGVGIIVKKDFNSWRELFRRKRKK